MVAQVPLRLLFLHILFESMVIKKYYSVKKASSGMALGSKTLSGSYARFCPQQRSLGHLFQNPCLLQPLTILRTSWILIHRVRSMQH
ncbi:hypothetical protein DDD64_08145 [Actinotignum sanguinis]|nr:hypothetical protein DDD64_08145 [Actinotignum sanguinis]